MDTNNYFKHAKTIISKIIPTFSVCILSASAGFAQSSEPYVTLTDDSKTLVFRYDADRANYSPTYDLNTENTYPAWSTHQENIEKVVFESSFSEASISSCYCWFHQFNNLKTIENLTFLNTEEVTTMYGMFDGCVSIENLDVSNFNTAKVQTMNQMFQNCERLTTLDLSNFNTTSVTDMSAMFKKCENLSTIIISSEWNVDNVSASGEMFSGCTLLLGQNTTTTDKTIAKPTEDKGVLTKNSNDDVQKITATINDITFPSDPRQFCENKEENASLNYNISSQIRPTNCTITIDGKTENYDLRSTKINIKLPEIPGEYTGKAVFSDGQSTKSDTIKFSINITAAKGLILQLYQNVIFINNASGKFHNYQWYRSNNDEELKGHTLQYYTESKLSGSYYAKLNNGTILACPWTQNETVKKALQSVNIYPNPAEKNKPFTIEINDFDPENLYNVIIYNNNGNIVKKMRISEQATNISMPEGSYTGAVISGKEKKSFKVIVK